MIGPASSSGAVARRRPPRACRSRSRPGRARAALARLVGPPSTCIPISSPSANTNAVLMIQRTIVASESRTGSGAVRRWDHQPLREAALEVLRDAEAGEIAGHRRRLQQQERERERLVARGVVEAGYLVDSGERAGEPDEEDDREHQGRKEEAQVRDDFFSVRNATARATWITCASTSPGTRLRRGTARPRCTARRSRSRSRAPGGPSRRRRGCAALDQVRDGVERGDPAEPVGLDQVARHVHRRQEQRDEEEGEDALHGLRRARAERDGHGRPDRDCAIAASRKNGIRARRRGSRRRAASRDEVVVDRIITSATPPARLPSMIGDAACGVEREPVGSRVDVASELDRRVERREERALDDGIAIMKSTYESRGARKRRRAVKPLAIAVKKKSGKTSANASWPGWRIERMNARAPRTAI